MTAALSTVTVAGLWWWGGFAALVVLLVIAKHAHRDRDNRKDQDK